MKWCFSQILGFAFFAVLPTSPLYGVALNDNDIHFSLQSNLEPFDKYNCIGKKSEIGIAEWDVECQMGRKIRQFAVHLVVNFYGKTGIGVSAYEFLYWVTDWSGLTGAKDTSTTMWLYNSAPEEMPIRIFDVSQGVANDTASLRIVLKVSP